MKAKQLKKGKATRIDNIPREIFIPDAGISAKYLYVCCNEVWKCHKKHKDCDKGLLVKRPLKGDI
jgi:hypothetical protein